MVQNVGGDQEVYGAALKNLKSFLFVQDVCVRYDQERTFLLADGHCSILSQPSQSR